MANRPTQLSRATLWLLVVGLGLSFISGLGLWYVHEQRERLADLPGWTSLCQTTHGLLNPLLCVVFGFLWCNHIRGGWKMRVNRKSGGTLTGLMFILIGSGAGLYYGDSSRHFWFTLHLLAGLLIAFVLPVHWVAARRWLSTIKSADATSAKKSYTP